MAMDKLPRLCQARFLVIIIKQNKKQTLYGTFYEGQEWCVNDLLNNITCLSIVD